MGLAEIAKGRADGSSKRCLTKTWYEVSQRIADNLNFCPRLDQLRCREQKCLNLLNLQISKIREHFGHTVLSHTHSFTGATITNRSSSNILVYRKKQQESTHTQKRPAGRQSRTTRQTTSNHSRPEHAVTGSVGLSSKTSYSPMPAQC